MSVISGAIAYLSNFINKNDNLKNKIANFYYYRPSDVSYPYILFASNSMNSIATNSKIFYSFNLALKLFSKDYWFEENENWLQNLIDEIHCLSFKIENYSYSLRFSSYLLESSVEHGEIKIITTNIFVIAEENLV